MSSSLPPVIDVLTWDYSRNPGPWCVTHKSVQCAHAISALDARGDVPHITEFLESASRGFRFKLFVPLWTGFFMWEDLQFEVVHDQVLGVYGRLIDRGKFATFDLGVEQLLRGESARDLGNTMMRQFADMMELDRPAALPGCRSGVHKMPYQRKLNQLSQAQPGDEHAVQQLMPHLYGLLGRSTPMCAFCWADAYGGDARRVSGNATEEAKVSNMDDLLFDG